MSNDGEIELKFGDVMQLNEKTGNPLLIGCFMVVTEPKSWGAQGYIALPGGIKSEALVAFEGRIYYRAKFEEMDFIGRTDLVLGDETEEHKSCQTAE